MVQVHQKQELVGYFEEENVQFWFDIAFEWQYLSETVPINLEKIKGIWTDVNKIFLLFWTLFRLSIVGLAWVWIGRRVEGWWTTFRQWLEKQDRPKIFDEVDFTSWDVPSLSIKTLRPNQ